MHYLLAFSMMILPVQSAWSMTDMVSSEMMLSAAHELVHEHAVQVLDDSSADHRVAMLLNTLAQANYSDTAANDMDCADDHCSVCAHVAYILPLEFPQFGDHLTARFVPSSDTLLDHLSSPEKPTPIHS